MLTKYREALTASQQRQNQLYSKRSISTEKFYNKFLHRLIKKYDLKIIDEAWVTLLLDNVRRFFNKNDLTFLAVDGTSDKVHLEEYAVFFAASYGVKGTFSLDRLKSVVYDNRDLTEELSMISYVPIPFAELGKVSFMEIDDQRRFSMADIHNSLMTLAEMYLIYKAVSGDDYPSIVLWDQSFSGMFHWKSPPIDEIPMVNNGYKISGKELTRADVLIVRSHPYDDTLDVPAASNGYFNVPNRILYELFKSTDHKVKISELVKILGENESEIRRVIETFMLRQIKSNQTALLQYSPSSDVIELNKDYYDSWDFCVRLVDSICKRIFEEKDASALLYDSKWITTIDIDFMISVLLRKVIEISWKKRIILIGIVKDSASNYFTRNYLGVMKVNDCYTDFEVADLFDLLWTDRLTLEFVPQCDRNLNSPWTTVEYDSVFQIVFLSTEKDTLEVKVRAIPTSERIFARSLALLFSSRDKDKVFFNHILFLDRVLVPELDKDKIKQFQIVGRSLEKEVTVLPFTDVDNGSVNMIQDFIMLFLSCLTKNSYPDVIGYPEPLHKADLGAKTFNKMVQPMIRSSTAMVKREKPSLTSFRGERRFK